MNPLPTPSPRRKALRPALVAAAAATGAAGLGALGTDIGPWYLALRQPDWKPPDAWFGPAWTLIFTLIGVAGARAWLRATGRAERQWLLWAFGVNGALNVLWSWLFFRWRRPDWALVEVVVFWLSIVVLIVLVRRTDPVSALLLVPYLLWVAFAAALNLAVVRLNPVL
ncbi:MAG TPA: TspO/MBR family protein [Burkholderiaceae bacterium]|nr:TspO/MBR family protein [Burkholderiaceae bacterium]